MHSYYFSRKKNSHLKATFFILFNAEIVINKNLVCVISLVLAVCLYSQQYSHVTTECVDDWV